MSRNCSKPKEIWINWSKKAKIYRKVPSSSTKLVKKWTKVVANLSDFYFLYYKISFLAFISYRPYAHSILRSQLKPIDGSEKYVSSQFIPIKHNPDHFFFFFVGSFFPPSSFSFCFSFFICPFVLLLYIWSTSSSSSTWLKPTFWGMNLQLLPHTFASLNSFGKSLWIC